MIATVNIRPTSLKMPPRRYPSTKAVVKYVPLLDQQFRARKRPVGSSWRMDETYVKVKGR